MGTPRTHGVYQILCVSPSCQCKFGYPCTFSYTVSDSVFLSMLSQSHIGLRVSQNSLNKGGDKNCFLFPPKEVITPAVQEVFCRVEQHLSELRECTTYAEVHGLLSQIAVKLPITLTARDRTVLEHPPSLHKYLYHKIAHLHVEPKETMGLWFLKLCRTYYG